MDEQLAMLLLDGQLEGLALEDHARALLAIPRVIALEPARVRTPRLLRGSAVTRQAARIWVPGRLRVLVLYHPAQYPLARALTAMHADSELWYVGREDLRGAPGRDDEELRINDLAARERAAGVLEVSGTTVDDTPLRERLVALEVISARAFVPQARFRGSWAVRKGFLRRP